MSSSVVIEHLKTTFEEENVGIAYVYFERANQEQQTSAVVVRSILQQLVYPLPPEELPADLFAAYRASKTRGLKDVDLLFVVLLSLRSKFQSTFVIFDALDECKETELESIMIIMEQLATASFRIFATSRPHLRNLSIFAVAPTIEIVAHIDDIKKYLSKRVDQKIAPQRALNKMAVDTIANSAQGV